MTRQRRNHKREVIWFLGRLSSSETGASGIGDSRATWRRTLESADWAHIFLDGKNTGREKPD